MVSVRSMKEQIFDAKSLFLLTHRLRTNFSIVIESGFQHIKCKRMNKKNYLRLIGFTIILGK